MPTPDEVTTCLVQHPSFPDKPPFKVTITRQPRTMPGGQAVYEVEMTPEVIRAVAAGHHGATFYVGRVMHLYGNANESHWVENCLYWVLQPAVNAFHTYLTLQEGSQP